MAGKQAATRSVLFPAALALKNVHEVGGMERTDQYFAECM